MLYLLRKKSWCALICSAVKIVPLLKRKERQFSVKSFMKTISNYFCVSFPHEFCRYCRCCRTLEKFFTIEPERRSIDALIVFIFFHLMRAQSTFLDQCLLFWKPSSSFTINVINPKSCLSAFAPPIVKSLFFLAEKSTRFHFQSKSILTFHLPISRAICFAFES